MSHVVRTDHARQVRELLEEFPVVGLLGPRQVGKTTLARDIASERAAAWFDLELPRDAVRLADPGLALEGLEGLVVIDEVQRQPELFPLLRVLVDRPDHDLRFLARALHGVKANSSATSRLGTMRARPPISLPHSIRKVASMTRCVSPSKIYAV